MPAHAETAEDVALDGREVPGALSMTSMSAFPPREWAAWAIRFVTEWQPAVLAKGMPQCAAPVRSFDYSSERDDGRD